MKTDQFEGKLSHLTESKCLRGLVGVEARVESLGIERGTF